MTPVFVLIALSSTYLGYQRFLGGEGYNGRVLEGRVTRVRDGDTIVVGATPVRFANLDCAEMGTTAGLRARQRMVKLVGGQHVTCRLTGERSYDRMIGICRTSDGRSVSWVMIREGYCGWW